MHESRARPLLIALLAGALCTGCEGHQKTRTSDLHAINWHGMRVDVGADYTLEDHDSTLVAKKLSTEEKKEYGSVVFRTVSPTRADSIEVDAKRCAAMALCRAELDSTGGNVADCYVLREGSHAGKDFTSSGYCIFRRKAMRATFACWNEDCLRTRSIIMSSFASLAKEADRR